MLSVRKISDDGKGVCRKTPMRAAAAVRRALQDGVEVLFL